MYYYINGFLEFIKFYIIFRYGFGIESKGKKNTLVGIGITIIYCVICRLLNENNFLVYIIWLLLILLVLFDENLIQNIIIGIGSIIMLGLLDGLSVVNVKAVFALFGIICRPNMQNSVASVITIIYLILTYHFVLKKESRILQKIGYINILHIVVLGFLYSLLMSLAWDEFVYNTLFYNKSRVYIVFLIITISVYYQLIILLKQAISNYKLKERDNMNRYLLQLQEQQYIYLQNTNKETKKFRHDIKNHINIISNLCRNSDIEKVQTYIDEVWGKMNMLFTGYHVNHNIVDAILNQYVYQCENEKIEFTVEGKLPNKCDISSYDLSTLFSNILQNAYEATVVCDIKEIKLSIRSDEFCIYIQVENTYRVVLKEKGGKLLTVKEDIANHGFGMENINECVRNYNGSLNYKTYVHETRVKKFLLQIMLYNRPTESVNNKRRISGENDRGK